MSDQTDNARVITLPPFRANQGPLKYEVADVTANDIRTFTIGAPHDVSFKRVGKGSGTLAFVVSTHVDGDPTLTFDVTEKWVDGEKETERRTAVTLPAPVSRALYDFLKSQYESTSAQDVSSESVGLSLVDPLAA